MRPLLKGPAARSGGDAESRQTGVSSKTKGWRRGPGAAAGPPTGGRGLAWPGKLMAVGRLRPGPVTGEQALVAGAARPASGCPGLVRRKGGEPEGRRLGPAAELPGAAGRAGGSAGPRPAGGAAREPVTVEGETHKMAASPSFPRQPPSRGGGCPAGWELARGHPSKTRLLGRMGELQRSPHHPRTASQTPDKYKQPFVFLFYL